MLREDLKYITVEHLRDTNQISVRTANCCINSGLHSLHEVISYFEKNQSFFKVKIRNAGQKTCHELDDLCKNFIPQLEDEKEDCRRNEEILQVIRDLSEQEREIILSLANLIIESGKILKQKERLYGQYCSDIFVSNFYEKRCHLPMLWILEQYIKSDKSREIGILIGSFNIFKNQQLHTLDELSTKYDLTRERVRQIRNNVFHKTFEITDEIIEYNKSDLIKYGMLLQNKDDWSYLLDFFKEIDILCQESFEVQNYLKEEKCDFSVEFALQIIAYIFRDRYSLLGGIDVSNKSKTWDNTFLIKREYSDIFDLEKMRVEFSNILMDNETDYLLNIEDYIANSQCWIKYDYNKTDCLISIVRDFLLYEFHLYSDDIDGQIKLPANKERKPIDVVYEILQQTGRPMHLDEIFEEFKVILPEHKYTEAAQLRPYLQKHEAISYRNRKSVYTLKEWEHIKTGTIRDAIVEFLSANDLPQTADDITEYILRYFPETNIASVRTTMFNDTQKRFSFFNDNIFGLKDKEYTSDYELGEQQEVLRKSFEQRLLDLELFILEEGHFPFASSEKSKKGSLGRWWYRIINNRQQINDTQEAEVNRVKVQYAEYDTDKTTYEWNLNYNKLKCFLLENRCIPSARGDEKFLYRWFRRAKEDFQNYNLTEEQRQKYIDLAKLI